MSHPSRGDVLLSGIPAARRVLARAPARIQSLRRFAVAGDRLLLQQGLVGEPHLQTFLPNKSSIGAAGGDLSHIKIFFGTSTHAINAGLPGGKRWRRTNHEREDPRSRPMEKVPLSTRPGVPWPAAAPFEARNLPALAATRLTGGPRKSWISQKTASRCRRV